MKLHAELLLCFLVVTCPTVRGFAPRTAEPTALAQAPNEHVMVVYNANIPESREVADHYMISRNIPADRRCAIFPSSDERISWNDYDLAIEAPIRSCLDAIGRDTILYIVFSYRTPFVLDDVPVAGGTSRESRSLDSFVAEIWDDYSQDSPRLSYHPYHAPPQSQGNLYPPFVSLADYRSQAGARLIYSVWRLDAPTSALARGLVDKAITAETNGLAGLWCLDRNRGSIADQPDSGYNAADWDLHRAADFARRAGFAVLEDEHEEEFGSAPAPARCDGAAFYSGWYSYNTYKDVFTWNTGAIGFHLDSASALNPRGGGNWSANALARGITVTSGAIGEPFLEGLPQADGVARDLLRGANAGDAFLRNTAFSRWMVINIGDPLYRPFAGGRAPFNDPARDEMSLGFDTRYLVGGSTATGTVTIARPAPAGGATVALSVLNYTRLVSVPATVQVSAGATSATFMIATQPVTDTPSIRIAAFYDGESASNTLTLTPRYEGHVDTVDCSSITGWAFDQAQPDAPLEVEIFDGDSLLARVVADQFRHDLAYLGYGDGRRGFSVPTPASVKTGQPRSIRIHVAGSDFTLDQPAALTCAPPPAPTPTPTPEGWARCADEGGFCGFAGTRRVRYGAGGAYAYGTFTGGVQCSNAVFGDPLSGVVKACDYEASTPTPTPTPTPESWTRCADEGGFCDFSGTRQVRYGVGDTYAFGTFTGGVHCSNSVFGDPVPGVVKRCDYAP